MVALNPVDGVRAPKAAKPCPRRCRSTIRWRSPSTAAAAADPALEARDACIVELLYGSGLRIAELVGLDVQASGEARGWVDLPGGEAHVLGKGSKRRSVPVGGAARAALQAWLPLRSRAGQGRASRRSSSAATAPGSRRARSARA